MQRRLPNWRRALATTLFFGAAGMLPVIAQEQPASIGSKFKVLVPSLERSAMAKGNFGRDVAEELRKLILTTPRHEPVEKKEMDAALKKFSLKADQMTCIQNMQLALAIQAELVLCGKFTNVDKVFQIDSAQIIAAKTQEAFKLQPITASSAKDAATQIFTQFNRWVNALQSAKFCYDYIDSQSWAQAIENCNAALAIDPQHARANAGKAFAYYSQAVAAAPMDQAKLRESLDLYKKVLENTMDQSALRMAGIIAARLGQQEESRGYFRQYLELNPGDAQVRLAIASEQAKAGDHEGALKVVEEGLKTDSANVDLLTWAGVFAAQAATRVNEEKRTEPNVLAPEARALYETAAVYYARLFNSKNGEIEPTIVRQYISSLLIIEKPQDAVEVGRRAVAANGKSGVVWASWATALGTANQFGESVMAFDSAIARNDTTESNLRARKAAVVLQSGDLEAARAAYQTAVQAGESDADQVSDMIWRVAMNEKYAKEDWDGVLQYMGVAREFAQAELEKAKLAFFSGLAHYQKGRAVNAKNAATAKAALPHFQRAIEQLDQAGPWGTANPNQQVAQTAKAVRDYITYLNELIKRG